MKAVAVITLLIVFLPLAAEDEVSIRIFARTKPVTVVFTPERGEYILSDGLREDIRLFPGETVAVTRYDGNVKYRTLSGKSAVADSLTFVPLAVTSLFRLRAPGKEEAVKTLDGVLKIKSFPGSLQVLNVTSVESYLPGVVRAEAGKYGPPDYFRAQAVVARTYVYRNISRHELDGYNLCDDIHCQVYPGMISELPIVDACHLTAGQVLVDGDSMLIVAAFHGNCGGVTASSAEVWLAGYPYLVSVNDPWCGYSASSVWNKSISLTDWNSFLRSKGIAVGRGVRPLLKPWNPAGQEDGPLCRRKTLNQRGDQDAFRTAVGILYADTFSRQHTGERQGIRTRRGTLSGRSKGDGRKKGDL